MRDATVAVVCAVLAAAIVRVQLARSGSVTRRGIGSDWIRAYRARKRGEPMPERDAPPFDLHNPRDVIILVVAALLFVASTVWLVGYWLAG